ncbi:MAG: amidohydrolase family protein [Oscillospiraceae bacterium]|nr:amidohydrolase family protein [Oscillospiraceae bacterium]
MKITSVFIQRAYESGLGDRVTASHTTAMHSYNNGYMMRLLKMSHINIVANPCVNIHLGGRADNYPKRRSVTRVKELTQEKINVSFGCDSICDPWNPLGDGGMRDAVFMGLYICHMLGYQDILDSYRFISYNAAKTLHLGESYGIKVGNPANFIILDAPNFYEALNNHAVVLYSYKQGKKLLESKPAEKNLKF